MNPTRRRVVRARIRYNKARRAFRNLPRWAGELCDVIVFGYRDLRDVAPYPIAKTAMRRAASRAALRLLQSG